MKLFAKCISFGSDHSVTYGLNFHVYIVCLLLSLLLSIPSNVESHEGTHIDNNKNIKGQKKETYKSCASHTKTQDLLSTDPIYKKKHKESRDHADRYVKLMRKTKNRSFNKKIIKNSKNKNKNKNKNEKEIIRDRKLLFSQYDDEIDNTPVIQIPIVYHVLYSNDRENLSDQQLDSQTSVLNKDFRALNDEITNGNVANVWSDRVGDTKIEFYKSQTIRTAISNPSTTCMNENLMKLSSNGGSDAIDPTTYLNIWICNISSAGLLGYACMNIYINTFCIFIKNSLFSIHIYIHLCIHNIHK